MCGRYELHTHPAVLALAFGLPFPPEIRPRYNIAPMQDVPIVRATRSGSRELAQVRWGLVPRWAKDASIGARMINARAETVATKPAYRTALRWHRCLIPADGFYEWAIGPDGTKHPMHVAMKDGGPFAFAGLSERWRTPSGDTLDTCTVITTAANTLLAPVHDRMPAIIAPADYARWLDSEIQEVADLLAPYPPEAMRYVQVSTRVNSVRNDDATLIEPVEPAERLAGEVAAPPGGEAQADAAPVQTSLF
ncbi:MAG: SOS response-associated peptidase [Burkholderiales bacterium]|nr:SOS response-associated peptidase [Burkholderiales bacterium]